MSLSVELYKFHVPTLWEEFKTLTEIEDTEKNFKKFIYVLQLHGLKFEDYFLILNNEHSPDYNFYYEVGGSLSRAFGIVDVDIDSYDNNDDPLDVFSKLFLSDSKMHKKWITTDIDVDDRYDVREKIREYLKNEKE